MLIDYELSQIQTVDHLIKIWTARYVPNVSTLALDNNRAIRDRLRLTVSKQGRLKTANKLHKHLIEDQCSLAAVRARELYSYYDPSIYEETANLAKFTSRIYLKLMEVYQESTSMVISSEATSDLSLETWGIPNIEELALELGLLLLELKERYRSAKSWQSVGFLSTQITLSNELILEQLEPTEQVFINCYLKFLEEQVSLPWQRVCAATAKCTLAAQAFSIVERMLPLTTEISTIVYERWSKSFQSYSSRRGSINHPGVKHSLIRDLDMFQAYLWLCFLEKNTAFIDQELSAICSIVLNALKISWEMIIEGVFLLTDEITQRLEPEQQELVKPYIRAMIRTFSKPLNIKNTAIADLRR